MDDQFRGIAEFLIVQPCEIDGQKEVILTGIFTNTAQNGNLHNEIARKTDQSPSLTGRYRTFYFDLPLKPEGLQIERQPNSHNIFDLVWYSPMEVSIDTDVTTDPKVTRHFRGIGFLFPNNRLLVYYEKEAYNGQTKPNDAQ